MDQSLPESCNPFGIGFPISGELFVGREEQIIRLKSLFGSLSRGSPSNLYIVGKGGTGKSSFLERIVEEGKSSGMLAFRSVIDIGKSAEENIDTLMKALLNKFEAETGQKGYLDDWKNKKTFNTLKDGDLRTEDLIQDLNRICKLIKESNKFKANSCIICADEGQRIHPITLSVLKNAFQGSQRCFMIVLSLLNESGLSDEKYGQSLLRELAENARDPGSERFFQEAAYIGAFKSREEAEDCINRRLRGNQIKFNVDAIQLIGEITGRHPGEMIRLSHEVYELAENTSQKIADINLVIKAFSNKNGEIITKIQELKDNWSTGYKRIYREFCNYYTGIKSIDLFEKIDPSSEVDFVQLALEKLCNNGLAKKHDDDSYFMSPNDAYALKSVLGGK